MKNIYKKLIIAVCGIIIFVFAARMFYFKNQVNSIRSADNNNIRNTITPENTTKEQILNEKIDIFMDSIATKYYSTIPVNLGYHCSHILYGYDKKYAYTWVYCSGFDKKGSGVEEAGSAFSMPTRLEYNPNTYFIINYKQPRDGSLSGPDIKELFPDPYFQKAINKPSNKEIENLEKTAKERALIRN